jgi:hypothetical protein
MKAIKYVVLGCFILAVVTGCAYRYYLGMHGPSILNSPEVHEGVTEDSECLECHHPERDPEGPPTPHPQFTGCLKCHNDPLN